MSNSELEIEFWNYVKCGEGMPKQAPDNMLIAYGYFKQATVGDLIETRSEENSDVVRTFMYDQWERMKGMGKEEAMTKYIAFIKKLFIEQGLKEEAYF